ncbi:MAG: GNAT family N-acetyltransferase [Alteromonadaceae bacterium]|nr:GNAT family N-acetyltransferase [Alteromonadaceae bacterium]
MKTTYRDFHSVDFDACLALFDSNVPTYFSEVERQDFIDFLLDLPGPYLVVKDSKGEIVACGGFAFVQESHSADLCWGMVEQTHHKRGLGLALLNARLERIRQHPAITHVNLNTCQKTEAFFKRVGFVTQQVTKDGFAPGLHRHDMTLSL